MDRAIGAIIVGRAGPFRDTLESHLCPPTFRILASEATLRDINRGELRRPEPCLVVIECGESPGPLTGQIAQLKQQNPLARVAVVGQRWNPADIATVFEAGANAYFAETAVTKEFLQAMNLLARQS
jgi:two-component system nitrate/nitrite response regulator NarL